VQDAIICAGADLSPKRIIRMDEPSMPAGDLLKT
jgi:hypothetical protein